MKSWVQIRKRQPRSRYIEFASHTFKFYSKRRYNGLPYLSSNKAVYWLYLKYVPPPRCDIPLLIGTWRVCSSPNASWLATLNLRPPSNYEKPSIIGGFMCCLQHRGEWLERLCAAASRLTAAVYHWRCAHAHCSKTASLLLPIKLQNKNINYVTLYNLHKYNPTYIYSEYFVCIILNLWMIVSISTDCHRLSGMAQTLLHRLYNKNSYLLIQ